MSFKEKDRAKLKKEKNETQINVQRSFEEMLLKDDDN